MAVAEKESEASGSEIVLVILLDGIADECDAGPVLFAMPPAAVGADSFHESLIHFGIGKGFGLAVVPTDAGEGSEILRKILLDVEAEAVFARDVPRMVSDIGRRASVRGFDDLIAIDAHVGGIGVGEDADDPGFFRE